MAIGGGHGLARSLGAASRFAAQVTAVVSVADDGGSTGRLRADLAIPAPGDLRKAIGALLVEPERFSPLLEHRFAGGDLAGHAFGNLLLAALWSTTGDFTSGVAEACRMLGTLGPVLPATSEPVVLSGETADAVVRGQVEVMATAGLEQVSLEPADPSTPPAALEAVAGADLVVLGPGSLFTSVLAALAAPDLAAAVERTAALVVSVCNLREQPPETAGYDVGRHVEALSRHGIEPDVVLADLAGLALGRVPAGTEVVTESLAGPNGMVHDEVRLAKALAALVPGRCRGAPRGAEDPTPR